MSAGGRFSFGCITLRRSGFSRWSHNWSHNGTCGMLANMANTAPSIQSPRQKRHQIGLDLQVALRGLKRGGGARCSMAPRHAKCASKKREEKTTSSQWQCQPCRPTAVPPCQSRKLCSSFPAPQLARAPATIRF